MEGSLSNSLPLSNNSTSHKSCDDHAQTEVLLHAHRHDQHKIHVTRTTRLGGTTELDATHSIRRWKQSKKIMMTAEKK